jgi:hypothetical protein
MQVELKESKREILPEIKMLKEMCCDLPIDLANSGLAQLK